MVGGFRIPFILSKSNRFAAAAANHVIFSAAVYPAVHEFSTSILNFIREFPTNRLMMENIVFSFPTAFVAVGLYLL